MVQGHSINYIIYSSFEKDIFNFVFVRIVYVIYFNRKQEARNNKQFNKVLWEFLRIRLIKGKSVK